jgi:uncharacterized membrane protein YeiH
MPMSPMLQLLDIFGTFAFAVSGAFRAVKYELDLLGLAALAVVTGIGGGIARDLLLGLAPPSALVDQTYFLACIAGAALVYVLAPYIARRWDYVMAADALGLAVFTAIGAAKAELHGAIPVTVMLLGMITACGGGIARDMLVMEIPAVLKTDFYATAALAGSGLYVLLGWAGLASGPRLWAAMALTLSLRCLAMKYGMRLPRVAQLPSSPSRLTRERKSAARRKRA